MMVLPGTMHLKAKVIRNLSTCYGVDCIAGQKLYKLLTRTDSSSDLVNKSHIQDSDVNSENETDEEPFEH